MIRSTLLLVFFFSVQLTLAQDTISYTSLSDQAWDLYSAENYREAKLLYQDLALTYSADRGENFYMAACCAGLLGEVGQGISFVEQSVEYGFWENLDLYQTDSDLDTLRKEESWKTIMETIYTKTAKRVEELKKSVRSFTHSKQGVNKAALVSTRLEQLDQTDEKRLFHKLENFRMFSDYQVDTTIHFCFWLHYKDSLEVPFLVQIPSGFTNEKPYPLFFQLHGGVRHVEDYPAWLDEENAGGWNRYFSEFADSNAMIMVYPYGTQSYNWMTPADGFDLIPQIIRQLKLMFNIDENRIYLSGHSNGATGAFSYAAKQQTPFARFFGLNTHPQVYTGGTFIRNLQNTHFYAVSTDQDYYYPQSGLDSLLLLSEQYGLGFTNRLYKGFPHWFPEFDESRAAIAEFFTQANSNVRNPFPEKLYWECDDLTNGRAHWLEILALDTIKPPAAWHQQINYTVTNWVDINDETQIIPDYEELAFNFPRRSAAVQATINNNTIKLQTSRVGELRVLLHPKLINMSEQLQVWVNNTLVWEGKPTYDSAFMVEQFESDLDRNAVWVNEINIKIPDE